MMAMLRMSVRSFSGVSSPIGGNLYNNRDRGHRVSMDAADRKVTVVRVGGDAPGPSEDRVAVEEPLEIRIAGRALGVTMRTPGHDEELAAGLLVAEGIVHSLNDIGSIVVCRDPDAKDLRNVVNVRLVEGVTFDWGRLRRALLTSSSCGVCGKATLDALRTRAEPIAVGGGEVAASTLAGLPATLRARQVVFEMTGGLHAAGLFEADGTLALLREDVGRHNAVDKVIGAAILRKILPLGSCVLVVSGRASFEIVQKAIVARIPIVAAVSAPSSLAVELAESFGVTLAGFVRAGGFNLYTHPQRIRH
jgi:FdhD protein